MLKTLALLFVTLLLSSPASAQVDLSGTWATRNHEDYMERWPGPDVGDFTGLPLNDDGRARALAYSPSLLSLPERQCLFYGPSYTVIGPFGFRLWSQSEPVTGRMVSLHMSGAIDKVPRTIWLDGRPHPSPNAPHTFSGFSTGEWQGRTLVVTTTHMKATPLRRNGAPMSDRATLREFFVRHDNVLTVTAVIDDPVYLDAPHILSRTFQEDPGQTIGDYPTPCVPVIESPGLSASDVPHYLPGQSPFAGEMAKRYGLPLDASLGGAETLYPEYRKKLEGNYNRPASCGRYCCGWGGGNTGALGGTQAVLACVAGEPPVRR